jgi:starch phosphorylase
MGNVESGIMENTTCRTIVSTFAGTPCRAGGTGGKSLVELESGCRMLFKTLDRQAWKESGHNPDKMLRELPRELLEKAGGDADYIRRYDDVMAVFNRSLQKKACDLLAPFSLDHKLAVAYFSAEYGLHRSLPFYAGGLGFLAGDFIKECSDLCVPLVAMGFMYPDGYLRQQIRDDGWQADLVEPIDREAAPISKVMDARPDGNSSSRCR